MGEGDRDDPLSEALGEFADAAAALRELKAALGRLTERIEDLERRAGRAQDPGLQ